jgi:hypothetical protein
MIVAASNDVAGRIVRLILTVAFISLANLLRSTRDAAAQVL